MEVGILAGKWQGFGRVFTVHARFLGRGFNAKTRRRGRGSGITGLSLTRSLSYGERACFGCGGRAHGSSPLRVRSGPRRRGGPTFGGIKRNGSATPVILVDE